MLSAQHQARMIPQLPLEIIRHILQLSLPPPTSSATFPIRYNHLRSLALVNSLFGSLAQEELFQHIFISEITRWSLLCILLETKRKSSCSRDIDYAGDRIKTVQVMYIGFPSHHSKDRLSQILTLAPNVESVHLEGVGSVDFTDLSVAPSKFFLEPLSWEIEVANQLVTNMLGRPHLANLMVPYLCCRIALYLPFQTIRPPPTSILRFTTPSITLTPRLTPSQFHTSDPFRNLSLDSLTITLNCISQTAPCPLLHFPAHAVQIQSQDQAPLTWTHVTSSELSSSTRPADLKFSRIGERQTYFLDKCRLTLGIHLRSQYAIDGSKGPILTFSRGG